MAHRQPFPMSRFYILHSEDYALNCGPWNLDPPVCRASLPPPPKKKPQGLSEPNFLMYTYNFYYACCFYPLSVFKSTPTSNGEGMGKK
jgi:hypothetical protein